MDRPLAVPLVSGPNPRLPRWIPIADKWPDLLRDLWWEDRTRDENDGSQQKDIPLARGSCRGGVKEMAVFRDHQGDELVGEPEQFIAPYRQGQLAGLNARGEGRIGFEEAGAQNLQSELHLWPAGRVRPCLPWSRRPASAPEGSRWSA